MGEGFDLRRVARSVEASFEAADDLLWQAVAGRLPKLGAITLARSGRIGPLVELAMASTASRTLTAASWSNHRYLPPDRSALRDGSISGAGARDRAGVFPLSRVNSGGGPRNGCLGAMGEARRERRSRGGLTKGLVGGLMGALGELQDNVFEHSGRPESGVVAYAANNGAFEFVVADGGRGVLASLRENPEFSLLPMRERRCVSPFLTGRRGTRAAQATAMVSDNCFGHSLHDAAELRFRSGDHALRLWGDAPSLIGQVELAQKAWLDGLTITVRCAPGASRRPP